MLFKNCTIDEAIERFKGERIYLFGIGSWMKTIEYTKLMRLEDQIICAIDSNLEGEVGFGSKRIKVHTPSLLEGVERGIIIITSPVYGYEMYEKLEEMQLPDTIVCYSFPFMQMITKCDMDGEILKQVLTCTTPKIPKIIHSFWFSGEEKPPMYQKCIDGWKEKLSDYKIIEWNQDNYDCKKHPFVQRAIECKAWAFASDYARLDVLRTYGGIYLDMDVEVYKAFDQLLGNDGFFSFANNVQIDLAVMGGRRENLIWNKLIQLYDELPLPDNRDEFSKYFQPALVRPVLADYGFQMDGSLQVINGNVAFPSVFFTPQEHILFEPFTISEYTLANHLDNFGWSFTGENKREKKIRDNRKLWKKITD